MVQLEPVTVQQDSRQPVHSSAKVKPPAYGSAIYKASESQQDLKQPVYSLAGVNHFTNGLARACDSSTTSSRQLVCSSVRNYSPSRQFSYI